MTGINTQFNPSLQVGGDAAQEAQSGVAQQGQYKGEQVAVKQNQSSQIQDALEELSFSFSEKTEKTLAKRKLGGSGKSRQLEGLEKIKALQDKLKDLDPKKLKSLVERFQAMQNPDRDACLGQAREFSKDPSHQYAALALAREQIKEADGDPKLLEALEQSMTTLMTEHGEAVRAGINVTGIASEFAASGLGDIQELRDAYRDTVLDYSGLTDTYNNLLEKYGKEGFADAVKYLLSSLGEDLASSGPSVDKEKLQTILDDVYQLEVLVSVQEDCSLLLARMKGKGISDDYDAHAMMQELLQLKDQKWLRPEEIQQIPARIGLDEVEDQIYFLREFKELARMIPLKAYTDQDSRGKLLDAIQQALDNAIDSEYE